MAPEIRAYADSLALTYDLARRIREVRAAFKLSEAEICAIIGEDRDALGQLERAEIDPAPERIARITASLRAYVDAYAGR